MSNSNDPVNRAWSGASPHRAAATQRLVAATSRCIARDGLAKTGITAVAAEAGVSRPTIYRYFRDRRALLQASLTRAGEELAASQARHLAGFASPAEQAVEAVLYTAREAPRHPVLGAIWSAGAFDALTVGGYTGAASIALTRRGLQPLLEQVDWPERETLEAVEFILRLVISLLAAPEPRRSEAELRAYLQRWLVPALGLRDRR